MRILSIFFTNDRKCIIASMLSKTGNYRLYYSLYPFEKKNMICERSFMVVPIGIKKGKLIYKEKNQVKYFYVPNCNASGFLNNVISIDYNTLLYDTYKNLSLSVTNDRGGNIVFVNQEKLNIPLHFIVKNCYFLDSKTLIFLCSSTLNSSMLVYYSIPERELNYLKMTSQLTFPLVIYILKRLSSFQSPLRAIPY